MNLDNAFSDGTANSQNLYDIQHALSGNAEEYANDPSLEAAWAIQCYENARTHMSLICSCEPKMLKLSQNDDLIYETFRRSFPKFEINFLDEGELKSATAKEKWRLYIEQFKDIIDNYNQGFLIRIDCQGNYDSDNTILVVKCQFLAIEIARNREGLNSNLRNFYKPDDIPPE